MLVELLGVLFDLAAILYLLQYDLWHKYDPPFITFDSPELGPKGLLLSLILGYEALNQSCVHSHTLPTML